MPDLGGNTSLDPPSASPQRARRGAAQPNGSPVPLLEALDSSCAHTAAEVMFLHGEAPQLGPRPGGYRQHGPVATINDVARALWEAAAGCILGGRQTNIPGLTGVQPRTMFEAGGVRFPRCLLGLFLFGILAGNGMRSPIELALSASHRRQRMPLSPCCLGPGMARTRPSPCSPPPPSPPPPSPQPSPRPATALTVATAAPPPPAPSTPHRRRPIHRPSMPTPSSPPPSPPLYPPPPSSPPSPCSLAAVPPPRHHCHCTALSPPPSPPPPRHPRRRRRPHRRRRHLPRRSRRRLRPRRRRRRHRPLRVVTGFVTMHRSTF